MGKPIKKVYAITGSIIYATKLDQPVQTQKFEIINFEYIESKMYFKNEVILAFKKKHKMTKKTFFFKKLNQVIFFFKK